MDANFDTSVSVLFLIPENPDWLRIWQIYIAITARNFDFNFEDLNQDFLQINLLATPVPLHH